MKDTLLTLTLTSASSLASLSRNLRRLCAGSVYGSFNTSQTWELNIDQQPAGVVRRHCHLVAGGRMAVLPVGEVLITVMSGCMEMTSQLILMKQAVFKLTSRSRVGPRTGDTSDQHLTGHKLGHLRPA